MKAFPVSNNQSNILRREDSNLPSLRITCNCMSVAAAAATAFASSRDGMPRYLGVCWAIADLTVSIVDRKRLVIGVGVDGDSRRCFHLRVSVSYNTHC